MKRPPFASMREAWDDYSDKVIGSGCGEHERERRRIAFYAGAQIASHFFLYFLDGGTADSEKLLRGFCDELSEFNKAAKATMANRRQYN